jgi:dolichyl-phosphate beta-glucosyltransferase
MKNTMAQQKTNGEIFLSVIIPCYNETENLERGVLKEVWNYFNKQSYTWEIIVTDDGSTDKSRDLVEKYIKDLKGFRILKNPHGGKPSTLLYGIKSAKGKYVLFSDMDQSTPISEVSKLLPYSKQGYKVVIGSRGLTRKDFPIYRKLGAYAFSTVRRTLILPEIVDTQCGFKLFEFNLLKKYFKKLDFFRSKSDRKGWVVSSWDVEFLHMVKKSGEKIKEVQIDWVDRDESKGKGSPLRKYLKESKEMLFQILRVKINDLRGLYH